MHLSKYSLPWGLALGILANIMFIIGVNAISILAIVVPTGLYGSVIYVFYQSSKRFGFWSKHEILEMTAGLIAGFAITFTASRIFTPQPVLETLVLIAILDSPVYFAYRLTGYLSKRRQVSLATQHYLRNMFLVLSITIPLLLVFAVSYWVAILAIAVLTVSIFFARERRWFKTSL